MEDRELEELFELYRTKRAAATESFQRINSISVTEVSRRETVKVTVGARGDITALEFPTTAYRRMASAELAEVILETLATARTKALAEAANIGLGSMLQGVNAADLFQGKIDPASLLPEDPFEAAGLGESFEYRDVEESA
ncbi:YbaB/EbfC family nucleoid-associated protein [Streptomyces sp. NPDC090493]|uniref:YbaB/EbfC family nucleoid-associated protein n=1 Tax=Streptomyces sp. NPDC090493 TaxID=3365964 RepID=UPI0037F54196